MKLKPCPFCGKEPREAHPGRQYVECSCGCFGPSVKSVPFNMEQWTIKQSRLHDAWNARSSGWISVDERLPEVDREVILYSSDDDGMCIGHRMRYIKKGYGYVESSDLNAVNGVTHWMPRPDSPETE